MIKKAAIALITISTGLLLNSLAYATDATTTDQTPASTTTTTNTGTTNPIAPSTPPSTPPSATKVKPEPVRTSKPKEEASTMDKIKNLFQDKKNDNDKNKPEKK